MPDLLEKRRKIIISGKMNNYKTRRAEKFSTGSEIRSKTYESNKKQIPNLFSVIEDWDLDSSPTPKTTIAKECCEKNNKISKNDDHRFSPGFVANDHCPTTTMTSQKNFDVAKNGSELPFVKFLKIDNGGRFVPVDDENDKKSHRNVEKTKNFDNQERIFDKFSHFRQPISTKKWPKTMRRETFSYDDATISAKKMKNFSSSKKFTRRSVDVYENDVADDSHLNKTTEDILCDPKPSFAPLRRRFDDQRSPPAVKPKIKDEFRIFKPSELFDGRPTDVSDQCRRSSNDEKFRSCKPSDVLQQGIEPIRRSPRQNFTQIKPKSVADESPFEIFQKFFDADSSSATTRSGANSVSSKTSTCDESATEYVRNFSSPNEFMPISSENGFENRSKFSISEKFSPSLNVPINDNMTDKKVPEIFNIYQQYEHYGLTDEFDFSSTGRVSNFSSNDIALAEEMQNLTIQKNRESLLNNTKFPPPRDFYGRSLFSYGP